MLHPSIADHYWRERAACRNNDPAVFEERAGQQLAKRICAGCAVRIECLTYALVVEADLATKSRECIYGGKTPSERHTLHRDLHMKQGLEYSVIAAMADTDAMLG